MDSKNAHPSSPQAAKLSRLPKGTRLHKRPLPVRNPLAVDSTGFDPSADPCRCKHASYVYVSTRTPFMAAVKRTIKALENSPQKTKGLPLTARIAALEARDVAAEDAGQQRGVLLVGTGRSIEKCLEIAAWFRGRKEYAVSWRSRTVVAVDDILRGGDELEKYTGGEQVEELGGSSGDLDRPGFVTHEDDSRSRFVTAVEIQVCWRD